MQMSIPGAIDTIYLQTKGEIENFLVEVNHYMATCIVPEDYIKIAMPTPKQRARLKRLREDIITDGYNIKAHLENALNGHLKWDNDLWRISAVTFWNHFTLSIERLRDYVQQNSVVGKA